jgi:hypothetical protein
LAWGLLALNKEGQGKQDYREQHSRQNIMPDHDISRFNNDEILAKA